MSTYDEIRSRLGAKSPHPAEAGLPRGLRILNAIHRAGLDAEAGMLVRKADVRDPEFHFDLNEAVVRRLAEIGLEIQEIPRG